MVEENGIGEGEEGWIEGKLGGLEIGEGDGSVESAGAVLG